MPKTRSVCCRVEAKIVPKAILFPFNRMKDDDIFKKPTVPARLKFF